LSGGYYDRIIESLKKKKRIVTIGLAFDFQEFNSLPISKFDQKLDYIVTNKNILQ
jgi:5-formyltetrahydrofolate cyclo-ligase